MRKTILALTIALAASFTVVAAVGTVGTRGIVDSIGTVAAVGTSQTAATPAPTQPGTSATPVTPIGTGAIKSGLTGKCLDLTGDSAVSGTLIELWDCNGSKAQAWTANVDGTLRIQGKCLDAMGAAKTNLTKIILWGCDGGANQVWKVYNGGYRNPVSGRCLDDFGASTKNGNGIILFDCNGNANQQWSQPDADGSSSGGGTVTPPATTPPVTAPSGTATIVRYPTPTYLPTSTAYTLAVSSQPIVVRKNFDYSFAQFAYSGTATFTITAKDTIDSYNISPHSYGVQATKSGKTLTFSLAQAKSRYLVIKVNNLENLVIAADPLETDIPVPNGGSVKNLLDYSGIDTTGNTLMTSKLQKAIDDAAARSGGGTVYVPAGVYKFTQIQLRSNVTLYLAAGAVLRGSSTLSDYDGTTPNIRFNSSSNAAIKGRGMIDSNGSALTSGASGPNRKNIITSSKADTLTVEGVTLRDGTTWNFNLTNSTHVTLTNVKIFNNVHWIHGDGFDLVNVSHAVVDQCLAYTGDDAFDAKSSSTTPMTDVVYQNSVAYTQSAGTKVGMQGTGAVSDLWFKNIDVVLGYRGVSVSHDQGGGAWSGIHFIDIRTEKIYNNGTGGEFRTAPILIWTAKYEGSDVGPISNVELVRVSFENLGGFHSFIQGQDGNSKVSNISIQGLKVNGQIITKASDALINIGSNTSGITFTS